jgi:hypothetical protein
MTASFTALGTEAHPPVLRFSLAALAESPVQAIALRAQVMIEPAVRVYDDGERAALEPLFGTPERWGSTTQPFLLGHGEADVDAFETTATFSLDVPFPAQSEASPVAYLQALDGGDVALALHFTGRLHRGSGIVQISWDECARLRVPVATFAPLLAGVQASVPTMADTMASLVGRGS